RPPGDNRWNHPPNPKGHHSNKSPKSCPFNRPELAFLLFPESGLMLVSLLLSSNGGCSSAGRAPGCDPGCRGFEPRQPPRIIPLPAHTCWGIFTFSAAYALTYA